MNRSEAEALALSALATARVELNADDIALLERFNPDCDVDDFGADYWAVYDFDGRRFIINEDGAVYIIDSTMVYFCDTENALSDGDEICPSEAL